MASTNFYNLDDLHHFESLQMQPYDPKNSLQKDGVKRLKETVWSQGKHLGNLILQRLSKYELEAGIYWQQRGWHDTENGKKAGATIKPYTWIKIYPEGYKDKGIFFTFGLDATPDSRTFVYKIDCRRTRGKVLSSDQINQLIDLVSNHEQRRAISFEELVEHDWESLTNLCFSFINEMSEQYEAIVSQVWGFQSNGKPRLIKQPKPNSRPYGRNVSRSFQGDDIDFQKKTERDSYIGNAGEDLVIDYEKYLLRNFPELQEKVEKVKDGMGFDIQSYYEDQKPKYIEVKTTTGDRNTPFYLSANELEFFKKECPSVHLYRIYHFDDENHLINFYELSGDIESQIDVTPINYSVLVK